MSRKIKKIVAIGGGNLKTAETLAIDKEIIRLSHKKHPTLLFIPTASSDNERYWNRIKKYYGKRLGCTTDVLYLIREKPECQEPPAKASGVLCYQESHQVVLDMLGNLRASSTSSSRLIPYRRFPTYAEIKHKILSADIIYVGGGNTLRMMKLWRRLGVDALLKRACKKGTVLCGISAGSICWFDFGHSDSMSFYHPKRWKYIKVRGLGFIKGIHCPHYDSSTMNRLRKKSFMNLIKKQGGFGIALDNSCALEFVNDTFRVIPSKKHAHAYKVFKKSGKVISERILETKEFTHVEALQTLSLIV